MKRHAEICNSLYSFRSAFCNKLGKRLLYDPSSYYWNVKWSGLANLVQQQIVAANDISTSKGHMLLYHLTGEPTAKVTFITSQKSALNQLMAIRSACEKWDNNGFVNTRQTGISQNLAPGYLSGSCSFLLQYYQIKWLTIASASRYRQTLFIRHYTTSAWHG
jgi:hypothetical protein